MFTLYINSSRILYSVHTVLLRMCGSQNKQRLFPYTTQSGSYNRDEMCLLRGANWGAKCITG